VPSLLTVRPTPIAPYLAEAVPHAYDEATRIQFRSMPGIKWYGSCKCWRGPRDAIDLVTKILEDAKVIKVRHEDELYALAGESPAIMNPFIKWRAELRDYQNTGVNWLLGMLHASGAALLADEMGIGKSAQAIVAADAISPNSNILVIAPAVVVRHWNEQIRKWGSHSRIGRWRVESYESFQASLKADNSCPKGGPHVFEPGPHKRSLAICKCGLKKKKNFRFPLEHYDLVIIDEVHHFKNPKSARYKAFRKWVDTRSRRPYLLALSGTPMTEHPRDLWAVLDLLWPGRFGNQWLFQKRYCDGKFVEIPKTDPPQTYWSADGTSRVDELGTRLRSCMLRRTKAEVALELPPMTRVLHEVELEEEALRDITLGARTGNKLGGRLAVSAMLSNIEKHKISHAIELAEDIRAAGGKTLILTLRKETAWSIADALHAPYVTGDDAATERKGILDGAEIGVATLYSVTTGIDLVGFDNIIFVGLDWIPATLLQGEARIHRIGQGRPVTIYYLVALHTLDEQVRERVIERLDVFAQVVEAGNDTSGLSQNLKGGTEDEIIAAMIEAAMKEAA
jgi:SNF2 family DNA or RNA helicase